MTRRFPRIWALALLASAACGGPSHKGPGQGAGPAAATPAPESATPELAPAPSNEATAALPGEGPLDERLMKFVGAGLPVAILPWPEGLVAMSSDGARRVVLAPGPVSAALVDNRAQVVWYAIAEPASEQSPTATRELRVLDLRGTDLRTHRILSRMPARDDIAVAHAAPQERLATDDSGRNSSVQLLVAEAPEVSGHGGIHVDLGMNDGKEHGAELARVTFDDEARARVAALARRAAGRRIALEAPPPPSLPDRLPVGPDCTDPDECGSWRPFPGTPYVRVTVWYACGDGCTSVTNLYDPRSQRYLGPDWSEHPVPLGPDGAIADTAATAADGSAFIAEGVVHRFGLPALRPSAAKDADSSPMGGGWLGEQFLSR